VSDFNRNHLPATGLKLKSKQQFPASNSGGGISSHLQHGENTLALMKTSNPALGEDTFRNISGGGYGGMIDASDRMSLNGTVNKTGILLVCAIATAAWTWSRFIESRDASDVAPLMLSGLIGGLIFAMITIFKKQWSAVTAPIYALLEGLVLGGVSSLLEMRFPGIAIEAVGLTFGTLFALLILYRTRVIRVTQKFRIGVFAATGGIALFYLLEMVLGMFGIHFTAINGSSPISIGFSLFVVAIAALNLVLDFDFIERGVQFGAPKYMEWYGAFGIMVTLVWLYLEILNLLSKMRSRN
jgi:uncharacterized YccA/Bax inhibitor family protein